jgi:crossover junction endodeoxyribonuclease RuvC
MIILGIDPGSRLLGYGVVEKIGNQVRVIEHGTIHLFHKEYRNIPVDETTPSRLKEIFVKLSEIIKRLKPQALAVEKVFFAKNAVSALKLGQARGVVLLTGAMSIVLPKSKVQSQATVALIKNKSQRCYR